MQKYHYALILESVGDFSTRNNIDIQKLNPTANPLFYCTRDCIRKSSDGRWELWYNNSQCFSKFFEKMHYLYETDKIESEKIRDLVYDASIIISVDPSLVQNNPYLLMPYTDRWLLCWPSHRTYLNSQAALLAEVSNKPHLLYSRTTFIDVPVIKAGLQLIDTGAKYIILITPGKSVHYIGPVNSLKITIDKFLSYFWPFFGQRHTKHILFETITCPCDPNDALMQMLGTTEKIVTFKDVVMRIVKDEQMELTFTAPNGDVFYATLRSVEDRILIRNLQKLSDSAIASYRHYYDTTKAELLAQWDKEYAQLRNQYQQALSTNIREVPLDNVA